MSAKLLKIAGLSLSAIVLFFGVAVIHPEAYLPHPHIVIAVPFDQNELPTSLIPMGETINHPLASNPGGHPGIDFIWSHPSKVLSSSAGYISQITFGISDPGTWDIEVRSDHYLLRYKELADYNRTLKTGAKVVVGTSLGTTHGVFHWELVSASPIRGRLCPIAYFDPASRRIIEQIWEQTRPEDNGHMKQQFPDICSGAYLTKVD